jgi:hypothetical protein
MNGSIDTAHEPIDLRKLYEEARRKWYIESGQRDRDERALYEALCGFPPSNTSHAN